MEEPTEKQKWLQRGEEQINLRTPGAGSGGGIALGGF
jgi:hypothetical protein